MTLIDLNRSKILTPLLKNLSIGLSHLSLHDTSVNKKITQFNSYLLHSTVEAEDLMNTLDRTAEIVNSYDIQVHENKTPGNMVSALPGIIYNAKQETEHLMLEARLKRAHVSVPALLENINYFCKLACEK